MYLLRKNHGIHSITYFELAANPKKSTTAERRERLQRTMRKWMSNETFEKLRSALQAEGFAGFTGEPDLFCWHPDRGNWFFAEAKGKDQLLESQRKWFRVCRETIRDVDIRLYRLVPE